VVILRIRQAETAMADGRLDEAYTHAIRDDVRRHRRGQRLITRLVERLLARGKEHANGGHSQEALADYDRAARLAGNQPEIAKLRLAAASDLGRRYAEHQRRSDLVRAASRHIDRGELTVGAALIGELDAADSAVAKLSHEMATKRAQLDAELDRAEQAIARRAYDVAIAALVEARRIQSSNQRLIDLTDQVSRALITQVRAVLDEGRVDLARGLLDKLTLLAGEQSDVAELRSVLGECVAAASAIEHGDLQRASGALNRIAHLLPNASWVQQAIVRTEEASVSLEAVRSGPLGLIGCLEGGTALGSLRPPNVGTTGLRARQVHATSPVSTGPEARRTMAGATPYRHQWPASPYRDDATMNPAPLPSGFLMQIDGAGSYVVTRSQITTIGPVSASRRPLVGLLAPADLPTVSIERVDDDYFLRCDAPLRVNDKPVTEKLLSHRDKIALTPRLALRFLLPNAASTSAVLELSGARLPRQDVRRIILLDESIVLGTGRTAHVEVRSLEETIVLHLRHGQLRYRCEKTHDGGSPEDSSLIPLGTPIKVGPLSLVLTELVLAGLA
jgi:tetratricopeptide (TPR) repeat protein